ncbi:MAG: hypothetical protein HY332_07690 [Chloroflexi bacterium]|nr:hypothetical protein [Chloroflexota bacterium]
MDGTNDNQPGSQPPSSGTVSSVGSAVGGVGEIKNLGVLDLTAMRSPEELDRITAIRNVGVVLVPESLAGKLATIPISSTGATVAIPEGQHVRLLTGQTLMGGEALANPAGEESNVLVVVGQLVLTSPVERVGYRQLIAIGQVVAPRGSEGPLGAGMTRLIGQALYYPYVAGAEVKVVTGGNRMSGEALANQGGREDDILLTTGRLVVTSPVERVGYRHIVALGDLFAPKDSEATLSPYVTTLSGRAMYYSGRPRFFEGKDRFARAFFELLEGQTTLVLIGKFVVEPDVPPELLRQKISEIVLAGSLRAPKGLIPVIQVLTTEKLGTIAALEENDQNGEAGVEK